LEHPVSFLTPTCLVQTRSVRKVIIAAVAHLYFLSLAFAQPSVSEGLSLRAQSAAGGTGEALGGLLPWIIGVVSITLIGILVVTLWPNESDSNPYQRQRKFARVDGLFLKIKAVVLGSAESQSFLQAVKATGNYPHCKDHTPEALTLLSLSFGGCSVASPRTLLKGEVILLDLQSLPDFPGPTATIAAKIMWTRPKSESGESYDMAGAKFLNPAKPVHLDALRQYLNFLMDEPLS
jgi:hypothetical protein